MTKDFIKPAPRAPLLVSKILRFLQMKLPEILGKDLFAVYVYGSLTYNAFNPATSDVDLVAVIKRDLTASQLKKAKSFPKELIRMFGARRGKGISGKDVELAYINKNKFFQPSLVWEHYAGRMKQVKYWDTFNPITWLNIRKSGITLFGPEPKTWVPKISKKHLRRALREEMQFNRKYLAKKHMAKLWSQVYLVLTLCRVAFTAVEWKIPSKQQAGEWALKHLDKKYGKIIKLALKYRPIRTDRKGLKILNAGLPNFFDYITRRTN